MDHHASVFCFYEIVTSLSLTLNEVYKLFVRARCCAVKQAATGETPVGRGPTRKILSAKEQKTVNDDRHKLSEHFIIALPRLLTKYQNDNDKVKNLLAIPNHFELDTYSTRRLDKQLDDLLRYYYLQ